MAHKIAIIGNGNVGSALEKGLARNGHEVRTTGRDPAKVQELARWGDLLFLAVPYTERENAMAEMGDATQGKVVVDVTNAVDAQYNFAASTDRSGAEELQDRHPGVKVVKAFNTVFAQHMHNGQAAGETLTLFVAGDDEQARQTVERLGDGLGFDPVDVGQLQNARWLETLGYLNITLGYTLKQGTETGFRYVHPAGRKQARQQTMAA